MSSSLLRRFRIIKEDGGFRVLLVLIILLVLHDGCRSEGGADDDPLINDDDDGDEDDTPSAADIIISDKSSNNNGEVPGSISTIFLNTRPMYSLTSPFSRRLGVLRSGKAESLLYSLPPYHVRDSNSNNNNNNNNFASRPTTLPPPPILPVSSTPSPVVAQIKMEIDAESIKSWPSKWWGCNSQLQQQHQSAGGSPSTTPPPSQNNNEEAGGEELFISSQIENLVVKAHIAIRAELLAATASGYPPPTLVPSSMAAALSGEADDMAATAESMTNTAGSTSGGSGGEQIWTKAEFKVLEIFRFSDLRGKAKPFLDAYTSGGRLLVSFQPSSALLMASGGGMSDSDCFSMFQTYQSPSSSSSSSVVIRQNNILRKRNIKVGLTYLLFIGINSATAPTANGSSASSSSQNSNDATLIEPQQQQQAAASPSSQQLHYSLLAPPLVFHKRFRHSIYNVLCTDCTNAPLIKQLTIKYNASFGVLSAYCLSPAHPIPTFTWSLDGTVLQENAGVPGLEPTLSIVKIKSLRKNSKIEITGLEENRAHLLSCSAQNYFGHATLSQPFTVDAEKMSILLLNDQHNRALNISGPATFDGDYTSTQTTSLSCLQDFGRSLLDWAFLNPWISVFIGLACVLLILAIALLILKCVLRTRYKNVIRHDTSTCPHHHHRRSPSLNAGTIVIDSSCTGDDCIANGGRNYLTAESKVPLLGAGAGGKGCANGSHLLHHHHHQHHQCNNGNSLPRRGLAVMVGSDTLDGSSVRRTSPGSTVSVDDGGSSSGGDKCGHTAASSNSTTSSSAGAVSTVQQQRSSATPASSTLTRQHQHQQQHQVPTTFRPAGAKNSPVTAPRPPPAVIAQSWHNPQHDGMSPSHLPNCGYQPQDNQHSYLYSLPDSQQVMYNQPSYNQTLLIRQQQPLAVAPPVAPIESEVVVRLLPALSAASSLAEFLGHSNEHIEVVPEGNEDQTSSTGSDKLIDDHGSPVMNIDSDEEIDRRRSERVQYMGALQDADAAPPVDRLRSTSLGSSNGNNRQPPPPPPPPAPMMTTSTSSNMQGSVYSGAVDPQTLMSSSQNTAIFRPTTTQ